MSPQALQGQRLKNIFQYTILSYSEFLPAKFDTHCIAPSLRLITGMNSGMNLGDLNLKHTKLAALMVAYMSPWGITGLKHKKNIIIYDFISLATFPRQIGHPLSCTQSQINYWYNIIIEISASLNLIILMFYIFVLNHPLPKT